MENVLNWSRRGNYMTRFTLNINSHVSRGFRKRDASQLPTLVTRVAFPNLFTPNATQWNPYRSLFFIVNTSLYLPALQASTLPMSAPRRLPARCLWQHERPLASWRTVPQFFVLYIWVQQGTKWDRLFIRINLTLSETFFRMRHRYVFRFMITRNFPYYIL